MRTSQAKYLIEISQPMKDFDAQKFSEHLIDSELNVLAIESIQNRLYKKIISDGFPVNINEIDNVGYIKRPKLESRIEAEIFKNNSVLLVGCEGSGKSTTIHVVASKLRQQHNYKFLYIDFGGTAENDGAVPRLVDQIKQKISNAIAKTLKIQDINEYKSWFSQESDTNPFFNSTFGRQGDKFVESILAFFAIKNPKNFYIIFDNLDPLSFRYIRLFFSTLNEIIDTVEAYIRMTVSINNISSRFKFIISCRTQTLSAIDDPQSGFFLKFRYQTIEMSERNVGDLESLKILKKYIAIEWPRIVKEYKLNDRIKIPMRIKTEIDTSFSSYASDAITFLSKFSDSYEKEVSRFCGRSIRRGKLFGLKVLGNPFIARMALAEKFRIFSLNRTDERYVERRILEAIFDFQSGRNSRFRIFPLNPFRVIAEENLFIDNPLIGVISIFFIREHISEMRPENHAFAQSVRIKSLVDYLTKLNYSGLAILECIQSLSGAGLLRPVSGSTEISGLPNVGSFDKIVDEYIIDDDALNFYISLMTFANPRTSIIFYASVCRYNYNISSGRHHDSILYDCFCVLVFLFDLVHREGLLEERVRSSRVFVRPLSARIKSRALAFIRAQIDQSRATDESKYNSDDGFGEMVRSTISELEALMKSQPGII